MCNLHGSRWVGEIAALIVLIILPGCGGSGSPHPVDSDEARSTLQAVLQSWQDGDTPESWQDRSPEVVVQDLEWRAGNKLESFEIIGDGRAQDANLHCDVKLHLVTPEGEEVERTVTYLVGTSPTLTVFRKVEL